MSLRNAQILGMQPSRRQFTVLAALGGILALNGTGYAQNTSEEIPPSNFIDDLDYQDLVDPYKVTGNRPPDKEVQDRAEEILKAAPAGPRPYDIARYFTSDRVPFSFRKQNASKAPWNPIVREMILPFEGQKATDMTPWCACFVNWILNRAHRDGSGSPAAISFLNAQRFEQTLSPREGDLVVYRFYRNSDGEATDAGHVGFRSSSAGRDGDLVLGGNQWTQQAASVICEQRIARETPGKRNGQLGVLRRVAYVRVV